jgi:hypothetical protein
MPTQPTPLYRGSEFCSHSEILKRESVESSLQKLEYRLYSEFAEKAELM